MTQRQPISGGAPIGEGEAWHFRVASWGSASAGADSHENGDRVGADGQVFSLADGVGGQAFGGGAAGAAVQALHAAAPMDAPSLANAFFTANNAVRSLRLRLGVSCQTTMTALVVHRSGIALASAGDSRAWLRGTNSTVRQLTVDDNEATKLGLTLNDPGYLHQARQLTKSLGSKAVLDVEAVPIALPPRPIRLFLTSDGIHDRVDVDGLREATDHPDSGTAASLLVAAALARETTDDASALVIDLQAHATEGPDGE